MILIDKVTITGLSILFLISLAKFLWIIFKPLKYYKFNYQNKEDLRTQVNFLKSEVQKLNDKIDDLINKKNTTDERQTHWNQHL